MTMIVSFTHEGCVSSAIGFWLPVIGRKCLMVS